MKATRSLVILISLKNGFSGGTDAFLPTLFPGLNLMEGISSVFFSENVLDKIYTLYHTIQRHADIMIDWLPSLSLLYTLMPV